MIIRNVLAAGAMVLASSLPLTASADSVADFYEGKTLTIYTAGGAAGPFNILARTFEPYLKKHIPGHPDIIVQAMPGAGGMLAANYLYNIAPKDGTAIGILLPTIALNQAFDAPGIKYDAEKFNYLNSVEQSPIVVGVWHTSPAKNWRDLLTGEIPMGSTGVTSNTFLVPKMMNDTLGTKFKIVTGYQGAGQVELAIERGEVQGTAGNWSGFKSSKPHWIKEKSLRILVQTGLKKEADLPDVPTLIEIAENQQQRELFRFYALGGALGRVFVAPPGLPEAQLEALEKAFADVTTDPQFLADARQRKMDPSPVGPEELADLVHQTLTFDPEIVQALKVAVTPDNR